MKADSPKSSRVKRRFIRHPSRMPIRFVLQGDAPQRDERLRNVGEGGLCFASAAALDPGYAIRLTIPMFGEQYEVDALVAWCRPATSGPGYEVGVRFLTQQDRFCVRMVEQLCYIEEYRLQVAREEGRRLSSEQAAEEWIERFADQFPGLH
ncbi:MAG: PilZ domain-containing protein [Chromatiaceae bacterium]|jgi:hypothetical protein|nr:PilZ domain-containing protein [Chromatiaceae bacterium]